jgi:two-component system phosphate regulon sensor histidine kinase PhoR
VVVPVLHARDTTAGVSELGLPAWFWRRLLASHADTIMTLPRGMAGPGSPAYVAFPILGFPGRPVAVAGWRFNAEGLRHQQLHEIVEREVYRDPRVFRGDVMQKGLAILLYDARGNEVYRSRPVGRDDLRITHEIGGLLPGWRVVAAPSRDNAFTIMRRFVLAEYVLMLALLALSLVALVLGLRMAMQQVELADLKSSFLANVTLELGRVRDEADSKRFLHVIGRECRRLTHMINNVLDFSKIEEGKREFFFTPTDLRKVVGNALEIFEPQFKQGDFRVTVDLPESMPPVELDPQAITQCVINLVDNAIKYSRDHHELAIRVSANGMARVAVTDRGIGVAPRDADRIFEKFTRAETGLVHNVKGSGLGLALVRHIARAHGGDVELKSVLGEGSTFTLVLPLKQAQRKEEDGWRRES